MFFKLQKKRKKGGKSIWAWQNAYDSNLVWKTAKKKKRQPVQVKEWAVVFICILIAVSSHTNFTWSLMQDFMDILLFDSLEEGCLKN